jgi:hypothetical protein
MKKVRKAPSVELECAECQLETRSRKRWDHFCPDRLVALGHVKSGRSVGFRGGDSFCIIEPKRRNRDEERGRVMPMVVVPVSERSRWGKGPGRRQTPSIVRELGDRSIMIFM